jgi:hypothetical protein
MPVGALIVHSLVMIVFCLSASRLRPRAPEAQSGRRAGGAGLDLKERARFGSVLAVCRGRVECILVFRASRSDAWGVLSAWRGRPAGTPFGFSVWALPVVMAATGGASCLSLVSLCIC